MPGKRQEHVMSMKILNNNARIMQDGTPEKAEEAEEAEEAEKTEGAEKAEEADKGKKQTNHREPP